MINSYMAKEARKYNGLKTVSLINDVGKTGQIHKKNKTGSLLYTMYMNKLKID